MQIFVQRALAGNDVLVFDLRQIGIAWLNGNPIGQIGELTLFPRWSRSIWITAWEQRKLSSIAASFDYGLNAAATEYDGKNKYLRITDIDDATHEFLKSDLTTPLADLAMSADYLLEEGDLLFARTGASVGKTYLYRQYDGTVYFAGFLIRARIEESADPEFVYQATSTDAYKKFVAITSQRSGQPGVNAQEYADYQLTLPSRTEQQQIGMTLRSLDNLITLHQRKCQYRGLYGHLSWEQRKFGELYRPVSEKNDMSFGRDRIISVANMYFNSVVYVTEDSYLATYNVMRLGDIAFEGNRSKSFAHGRFVENTIGDGIVSHVFKVFRPVGNNFDLSYWKHAINNEKLMKDVLTRSTKASTMMHELVSSDFLEESTLVPSLDEQRAIGTAIDSIDNLITLHQ